MDRLSHLQALSTETDQAGFEHIMSVLPRRLREALKHLPRLTGWEEIRLRTGRPLAIWVNGTHSFVSPDGQIHDDSGRALRVEADDVEAAVSLMTGGSAYAAEEEMGQGFLTLPGGHRVGVAGRTVANADGSIRLVSVGSLNIRRGRAVRGAATPLVGALHGRGGWRNTLIVSPPGCGKTTLLRDLVRLMSDGHPQYRIPARRVGLVDERSEVAACIDGEPLFDVGCHTDVMDACPKAHGMLMLLRSMGPDILATDELGREEDAAAVREAVNAGVTVVATVHGRDVDEVRGRPGLGPLLSESTFSRAVVLSRREGPGTVEGVMSLC